MFNYIPLYLAHVITYPCSNSITGLPNRLKWNIAGYPTRHPYWLLHHIWYIFHLIPKMQGCVEDSLAWYFYHFSSTFYQKWKAQACAVSIQRFPHIKITTTKIKRSWIGIHIHVGWNYMHRIVCTRYIMGIPLIYWACHLKNIKLHMARLQLL